MISTSPDFLLARFLFAGFSISGFRIGAISIARLSSPVRLVLATVCSWWESLLVEILVGEISSSRFSSFPLSLLARFIYLHAFMSCAVLCLA